MDILGLQKFRSDAASTLTTSPGVYALCDLDEIPIYVGQSKDGIRNRVRRHLTSARSDVIANRQLDVWEVAYVWAYPCDVDRCSRLEAFLYHHFNRQSPLFNGAEPPIEPTPVDMPFNRAPEPAQRALALPEGEIARRLDPAIRAPRQIAQYQMLADYFLNVKRNDQMARVMNVHFWRLKEMHETLMSAQTSLIFDNGED